MRKKALICFGIIVILAGMGYGGYRAYIHYSYESLRKARAWAQLGNYQKAAEKFEEHLLKYPDDWQVKLEYAGALSKQGKKTQAIDVYKQVINKGQDVEKVKRLLFLEYMSLAYDLSDQGDRVLEKKKFPEARDYYKKAYSYMQTGRTIQFSLSGFVAEWIEAAFSDLIVDIAWTYALEGECRKARGALYGLSHGRDPPISRSSINLLYGRFGDDLNELGVKLFDQKKFKEARICWEEALWILKLGNAYKTPDAILTSDGVLAEIKYNIAVTYFNEKENKDAIRELLELKNSYPNYSEMNQVNRVIKEAKSFISPEASKPSKSSDIVHIGDTPEKVKAILGNPHSISKSLLGVELLLEYWHYGSGYIEFIGINVAGSWRINVAGSWRIKIDPIPRKASLPPKTSLEDTVHIGDTEERVKAILSNPDSISQSHLMDYWWYGRGYIEFSGGHVVGSNGIKIDSRPREE